MFVLDVGAVYTMRGDICRVVYVCVCVGTNEEVSILRVIISCTKPILCCHIVFKCHIINELQKLLAARTFQDRESVAAWPHGYSIGNFVAMPIITNDTK